MDKTEVKDGYDIVSLAIGGNIEAIRLNSNISQKQLADQVGLSRVSIVNIEAGRQKLSALRVYQFAVALNCDIADLMPTKEFYLKYKDKKVRKVVRMEIVD